MSATVGSGERPLRADARRNRERIVAAASAVFAQHGSVAQIDEIAARAEVGVGTVYRHFPTKDALMGELVRQKFERLRDRAIRFQEVADPWEALAGMLRESAEEMEHDQTQRRMMWEASPAAVEIGAPARQELQREGGKLVARAHEAGVLRRDFTVEHIGPFMCGLGSAMEMLQSRGERTDDWRKLLEVFLDGLRPR
ncbi:MAG TPA: helix-turn-helix domain-containing protein [Baekduia sp.]|nr:helix-turn-helix domain-containing protein [Baekduia sp.]